MVNLLLEKRDVAIEEDDEDDVENDDEERDREQIDRRT
jgi:hypothetical protein